LLKSIDWNHPKRFANHPFVSVDIEARKNILRKNIVKLVETSKEIHFQPKLLFDRLKIPFSDVLIG